MEIRTEIPEARGTEPDLSDADETLEIVRAVGAVVRASSEPVIRTMEVTADDILEVHAAVAAMEASERAEAEAASPDRTLEVSVDDVLVVEPAELPAPADLPTPALPRVALPEPATSTLRTERTGILPRVVAAEAARIRKEERAKRANMLFVLGAAAGTWAFFVGLASLGTYGAYSLYRAMHHGAADAQASAPAMITNAETTKRPVFVAEPVPERAPLVETADDSSLSSSSDDGENVTRASSGDVSHARGSGTGILRFATATNGVLVDGSPRRVTGGALFVTCGSHRIRQSHEASRTVFVPCGKTVVL